jgi:hypothetical protein
MEDPTDTNVLIVKRHFLDPHLYVFIPTRTLGNDRMYVMHLIVDDASVCKVICVDTFEFIEWGAKLNVIEVEPLIQLTPE